MWTGISFFLSFVSLVTGANSFTLFHLLMPISNLKVKQMMSYPYPKILSEFSLLLCIIKDQALPIFFDVHTRTKGTHIGDHEIKIVNFADDTTILLRHFSYFTKTEVKF